MEGICNLIKGGRKMSFNFSELNRNNRLVVLLLVAIIAILLFTRPLKAQTGPHLIKATGIEFYNANGTEVGGVFSFSIRRFQSLDERWQGKCESRYQYSTQWCSCDDVNFS